MTTPNNQLPDLMNYELESKIGERVKEQLEALKKTVSKELKDIVWTACNDYVEHAQYEPLENWKDRERYSLIGAKYAVHKDCFWGKTMRAKIFDEHRDVITPMIQCERIEELEKEVSDLKKRLKFETDLNRSRY